MSEHVGAHSLRHNLVASEHVVHHVVAITDVWDPMAAHTMTRVWFDGVLGSDMTVDDLSQLGWQLEERERLVVCIPPLALSFDGLLKVERTFAVTSVSMVVRVVFILLGLCLEIVDHEDPLAVQADLNLAMVNASFQSTVTAAVWNKLEFESVGIRGALPSAEVVLRASRDPQLHHVGVE